MVRVLHREFFASWVPTCAQTKQLYRLVGGKECKLPLSNGTDHIDGVIVTYSDITGLKRRDEAGLAARRELAYSPETCVGQRTEQLRVLMFELGMAEERERRNISIELHDGPGQLLTLANLKLANMDRKALTGETAQVLKEVRGLISEADKRLHSLIFQLSPPILYELGLVAAIKWLADDLRATYGLEAEVTDDGQIKPFDGNFQSVLFRAVRELLINVAKHAMAGKATVHVRRAGDQIEIAVADRGVGFDFETTKGAKADEGLDLGSVRERLTFLGGGFHIDSTPGGGTMAVLVAPLPHVTDDIAAAEGQEKAI